MKVAVTWEMSGYVDIDAPTMEEAMEKFLDDMDHIPLPRDGEYIDGSFELSSKDPEILKTFADIMEEAEHAQAGSAQTKSTRTQAVEFCPHCESENVFPDWDTEKQGYTAKCQHCGETIILCDECLHADDNTGRGCDWHEKVHGNETWGICFRGMTKHQANPSTGSTLTGESRKSTVIYENDVTAVLRQRWIACYMLYDWNPRHADDTYLSNKYGWVQQTYKRLKGKTADANTLTDTFNQILLADVEDFIQTHMKVWQCDRLTVESQVTKAVAELSSKV